MIIQFKAKCRRRSSSLYHDYAVVSLEVNPDKDFTRKERELLADRLCERTICHPYVTLDGISLPKPASASGRPDLRFLEADRPTLASLKVALRRSHASTRRGLAEIRELRLRLSEAA